jgi:hypothetical protein
LCLSQTRYAHVFLPRRRMDLPLPHWRMDHFWRVVSCLCLNLLHTPSTPAMSRGGRRFDVGFARPVIRGFPFLFRVILGFQKPSYGARFHIQNRIGLQDDSLHAMPHVANLAAPRPNKSMSALQPLSMSKTLLGVVGKQF